jgi:hypothetical protein
MKPTIEKIKLKFVTKIKYEMIANMLTGKETMLPVLTGDVHIFELFTDKNGITSTVTAFCGKSHAAIGEKTKETDKRPENLSICKQCEQAWKEDPRSPWKAWRKAMHGT